MLSNCSKTNTDFGIRLALVLIVFLHITVPIALFHVVLVRHRYPRLIQITCQLIEQLLRLIHVKSKAIINRSQFNYSYPRRVLCFNMAQSFHSGFSGTILYLDLTNPPIFCFFLRLQCSFAASLQLSVP